MKITVKNAREIEIMHEGGRITAAILRQILAEAKPQVTGIELENLAESLIDKFKVKASFKTVRNYPYALCVSFNEEVVHGLPDERKFKDGDLLSVDLGVLHKGFHTDIARTIIIKTPNSPPASRCEARRAGKLRSVAKAMERRRQTPNSKERFLKIGQKALNKAVKKAVVGNRVGHISQAIQETIEAAGYNPVKSLVGHGVGRELHEDPQIPCFLRGKIEDTPQLREGMTLAIEIMYAQGGGEVKAKGWTIVTKDRSLAGHFEDTIVVTPNGPMILTR